MDVGVWLRSLGLGQYEATFRDNEIDGAVLPKLTVAGLVRATAVACGWPTRPLVGGCLRHKRPPLRQCSRASLLVVLPGDEMPLLIELVVDLGVN
jgi:hypothetical protein